MFPARVRSYSSRYGETVPTCSILEAALAAVADPKYFNPVKFGESPVSFRKLTGADLNCAKEVLDEATLIWDPQNISCLVSVGCEIEAIHDSAEIQPTTKESQPAWADRFTGFLTNFTDRLKVGDDVNRVAEEVRRGTRMLGIEYFRFNCKFNVLHFAFLKRMDLSLYDEINALLNQPEQRDKLSSCGLSLSTKPSKQINRSKQISRLHVYYD
jgi:hypothetical protein